MECFALRLDFVPVHVLYQGTARITAKNIQISQDAEQKY